MAYQSAYTGSQIDDAVGRVLSGEAVGPAGPAGATGPAGPAGATGPKGDPGDTPYIGENGNWWISGRDTGVSATGGGNADTASKLATARNIDGVNFDGSANIMHYGFCETVTATAEKTVSLPGFKLVTGARIAVKFRYSNGTVNPTLNVNGTGAKNILTFGAVKASEIWSSGSLLEFVYDGANYMIVNGYISYIAVNHNHSNYVPITRTINGKSLGSNITLTASDVNARSSTWMPTAAQVGAIPSGVLTNFNVLTQAEYDALSTKSGTVLYLIKE